MPQQNLVTVNFTGDETANINAAILSLKEALLPKLKQLNPEEKKDVAKMGDKTLAFVQKALEQAETNPELVPPFLDVNEFRSDFNAVETLRQMEASLEQISDALRDTIILAGSDAFSAALMFYDAIKSAKKTNVAKAGAIFDDLSVRFPRGKKKAPVTV
ncbi:MAG: hypothetical protein JXN64_07935 [Spirochaetes bacterium]|nr:hypothetical protein [Spirochaetota bacterium]